MSSASPSYLELAFATAGRNVAALNEALQPLAPGGLVIEEPYIPLGPEEGARLEFWRPTIVRAYLPDDSSLDGRRSEIDSAIASLPFEVKRSERLVREEDWAESWKQFFQIERVGQRIVIRPSWRDYHPRAGEVVLDLDPGMAFGTGQHPTTRLCLAVLEERLRPGMTVLDLGCGSGILSLAAVKLGAGGVDALDTEQVAVDATRANAHGNHVDGRIAAERGSLGESWPFGRASEASADLIVANISAGVLVELASPIAATLRPPGIFIGSGVVADRVDEVLVALAAAGLRIEEIRAEGEWRAILARLAG